LPDLRQNVYHKHKTVKMSVHFLYFTEFKDNKSAQ